jgi:hypothetical protein
VVRKRFETVRWPALMSKNFTMKDMKERLTNVRNALKGLEEVSGKVSDLKAILNDQQTKYNFLRKPEVYYKEFCKVLNSDTALAKEQLDVRRLPAYYVHRRIRETLDQRLREIRQEKERKFRTTLSDHVLFAIICDSRKVTKKLSASQEKKKQDRRDRKAAEAKAEADADEVDWSKVNPKPEGAVPEEEKEAVAEKKKNKREKMYDKEGPFARDVPLLVHRLLREKNYEYVFFANEAGNKEVGVFLVLLDALTYKAV